MFIYREIAEKFYLLFFLINIILLYNQREKITNDFSWYESIGKKYGKKYISKQGDAVYLNFNPTKGHEQSSFKPVVIISNNVFNENTKMVIVCPVTSNEKEFPTHYSLEDTKKIFGSVLCEHIRSIDYEIRNLRFVEKLSDNDLMSIITLLNACIEEK